MYYYGGRKLLIEDLARRKSRWLGNGSPDVSRVQECAKNRVILIGTGELTSDEAHLYKLPLPFNFSTDKIKRKLTVTLSYLTSTDCTKQKYRGTQIWYEVSELDKFKKTRQNSDWQGILKVLFCYMGINGMILKQLQR